jgi:hypothetical protein
VKHIVLLGDSIFDNQSYTRGAPDVPTHLGSVVPEARITLRAVDGATTADLGPQFEGVPGDATHVILSVGGNDALRNVDLLGPKGVRSTAEALRLFGDRLEVFEAAYVRAIERLVRLKRPATVCTIYNGNLSPSEAPLARIALMLFNDTIIRTALRFGVDVIELRLVCTEPEDYANPIEPSGQGGLKIARAIAAAIGATKPQQARISVTRG